MRTSKELTLVLHFILPIQDIAGKGNEALLCDIVILMAQCCFNVEFETLQYENASAANDLVPEFNIIHIYFEDISGMFYLLC